MTRFQWGLIVAAAAMPAAAFAETDAGLPLSLGQQITIELSGPDDAPKVMVVGIGRAVLDADGVAMARKMAGTPCETPTCDAVNIVTADGAPVPPAAEPGKVRFGFLMAKATGHTILMIENGYDRAVTYRARISRDGEMTPTDVCLVAPSVRTYEDWPYKIDKIEISQFQLQPWKQGDPVPCA
jgi:hypothetical protein